MDEKENTSFIKAIFYLAFYHTSKQDYKGHTMAPKKPVSGHGSGCPPGPLQESLESTQVNVDHSV